MSLDALSRTCYTPDHEAFRHTVRQFVAKEIEPNAARWDEYIESQKRIAKAAADAGATVILSNHSEYDNAYTKARLIGAEREVGENHPFVVGADGVQRYFTVMTECATASKLRVGAK